MPSERASWGAAPILDANICPMARELLVDLEMTELGFSQKLDVLAQTFAAVVWGEVSRQNRKSRKALDFIGSAAAACWYFQVQVRDQCKKLEKSK